MRRLRGTINGATIIGSWNAKQMVEVDGTLAQRNNHWYMPFVDSATSDNYIEGVMPPHFNRQLKIVAKIEWVAATATSGDVLWRINFEKTNADTNDIDTDGWDTNPNTEVLSTANASSSGKLSVATFTFDSSALDGLIGDDMYRIRIRRRGADGSDDMVGDAQIVRVLLEQSVQSD